MSLLVISEILRLFANTLTAVDKYSLHVNKNLMQTFQMQLPTKLKNFVLFLRHI